MIIGGLRKISMIDYPGEICSVVFTRGCNMKCIFCHNSHLVFRKKYETDIPEHQLMKFLTNRTGKIDAVTISGGEPTLHNDLPLFIAKIKELGFKVKLDTNGTNPEMLQLLSYNDLVDYFAMDIKSDYHKYSDICGVKIETVNLDNSIEIIKSSGADYEFRMTYIKNYHTPEEVSKIEKYIDDKLILNRFVYTPDIPGKNLSVENEITEKELLSITSIHSCLD